MRNITFISLSSFILALVLSSAACESDEEPIIVSGATACVSSVGADAPTVLGVGFDGCEPCSEFRGKSCEVTLDGNVISVRASATFEPPGDGPCVDICRTIEGVSCNLPALDQGTYELQFEGRSAPFEIPFVGDPLCVGNDSAFD